MEALVINKEFGWTLCSVFLMLMQYGIFGPYTVTQRKKYMTKELLEKYKEKDKDAEGKIAGLGYPDFGSGRYSMEMSYKDWFYWNCAVRVHHNAIEWIVIGATSTLVLGIFKPYIAAGSGLVWFVFRLIYTMSYHSGKVGRLGFLMFLHFLVLGFNLGYGGYLCVNELIK